jgi:N-acetylneuraminate synthase
MIESVLFGNRPVGPGYPAYITAEIGINHNGDLEIAERLIDAAVLAGCDAVKFQKRTPELCVPPDQQGILRETPWGIMTYLDYRYRVEFDESQYRKIGAYCAERGVQWFASCWDVPSIDFMEMFEPVCYKVASASVTDVELLAALHNTGRPIVLSTGMSTIEEIDRAVEVLGTTNLVMTHSTSAYPCRPDELNLSMISTLTERYQVPVGYSGHETGLATTIAAVAMGACFIERHITLDRAMWGTDQAASVEPGGLSRLVRDIRVVELATGDGVKVVYDSELPIRAKLRRVS